MDIKQNKLLEAVAEIAWIAGATGYVTANSRDAIDNFIAWGKEFESKPYDDEDYMELIEKFAFAKIGKDSHPGAGLSTQQQSIYRDMLCTIIEGGSNYWASFNNVKRTDRDYTHFADGEMHYLSFEMRDSEDASQPWRTCNMLTIAEGVQKIAEGNANICSEIVTKCRELICANVCADDVDIDAGEADAICQIGLFGELVFS